MKHRAKRHEDGTYTYRGTTIQPDNEARTSWTFWSDLGSDHAIRGWAPTLKGAKGYIDRLMEVIES